MRRRPAPGGLAERSPGKLWEKGLRQIEVDIEALEPWEHEDVCMWGKTWRSVACFGWGRDG